jgi:Fic family protein
MLDQNWETLTGDIAANVEFLNYTNQINVLNGLMHFLLAHKGPNGAGKPPMPDEASLRELHHAGTLFLLAKPGQYRNIDVHVKNKDGVVTYDAPPWQHVEGLVQLFFRQLSSIWNTGDALDVAAYALWKINWVHPFRNGNGRTARAFCYACMCLRLGVILPGTMTVIDLIMGNRDKYEAALKNADKSFKETGSPDLGMVRAFLDECLQTQMASIENTHNVAQA